MSRCSACPNKHSCVEPVGPWQTGGLYFLGEAPGWDEDRKKEPFVGKTGREVNEGYFPLCGIRRPQVRINNAIRCLPDRPKNKLTLTKDKDRELLQVCASHHLYPELEVLKPRLIIAMGAFACHAIEPEIDLDLHHGIPLDTDRGWVFPMYHPAGGIHEPKKMLHIRTDWARLRKLLHGTLSVAVDPFEGREDYREIFTEAELDYDITGGWADPPAYKLPLPLDTESKRNKDPFCLTYSVRPGHGRLIRAGKSALLRRFQYHVDRWESFFLWHNWLYDWNVTDRMELHFPHKKIIDTMVKAFHLGNVPQGLKALSYRECGMAMKDFDDLVTPFSTQKVLQFYRQALEHIYPKPEPFLERQSDGSMKLKKPHSMNTKLKGFLTSYRKAEILSEDKDVFRAWEKNWLTSQKMVEEAVGEQWPGKCISHAAEENWEEVLWYACRDSDALGRVYPILKHMERRTRRTVQENWRDAA